MTIDLKLLSDPFTDADVKWRVGRTSKDGRKVALLAYVDARSVQRKLDNGVGAENWSVSYTPFGDGVMATLSLRIDGEWISKSDIGSPSSFEKEKGAVSDAFKRASVCWGIGRHLYDLPEVWKPVIEAKPSNPRAFWVKGGFVIPPKMSDFAPKRRKNFTMEELKRFADALQKEFGITVEEARKEAGNALSTREERIDFYTKRKAKVA